MRPPRPMDRHGPYGSSRDTCRCSVVRSRSRSTRLDSTGPPAGNAGHREPPTKRAPIPSGASRRRRCHADPGGMPLVPRDDPGAG
jgi:hypothetical protein